MTASEIDSSRITGDSRHGVPAPGPATRLPERGDASLGALAQRLSHTLLDGLTHARNRQKVKSLLNDLPVLGRNEDCVTGLTRHLPSKLPSARLCSKGTWSTGPWRPDDGLVAGSAWLWMHADRLPTRLQLVESVAQTGRLHLQRQYRVRRHFSQLRIDHADARIA